MNASHFEVRGSKVKVTVGGITRGGMVETALYGQRHTVDLLDALLSS